MLKILATPPVSQGKEKELVPQRVLLLPQQDGRFVHPELLKGIIIEPANEQGRFILKMYFQHGFDAWPDGLGLDSLIYWATLAGGVSYKDENIPEGFDLVITLTDHDLTEDGRLQFDVMEQVGDDWQKVSDIQLQFSPDK